LSVPLIAPHDPDFELLRPRNALVGYGSHHSHAKETLGVHDQRWVNVYSLGGHHEVQITRFGSGAADGYWYQLISSS
jgi:hypothetical protein